MSPRKQAEGKILVMDDEKRIRTVTKKMLGGLGYTVVCARDGEETIELYRSAEAAGEPFDAVILDVHVPEGMGGSEAVKMLRELDPEVKVIICSADHENPLMKEKDQYGVREVLSKPFTFEQLRQTVIRVVKE